MLLIIFTKKQGRYICKILIVYANDEILPLVFVVCVEERAPSRDALKHQCTKRPVISLVVVRVGRMLSKYHFRSLQVNANTKKKIHSPMATISSV